MANKEVTKEGLWIVRNPATPGPFEYDVVKQAEYGGELVRAFGTLKEAEDFMEAQ